MSRISAALGSALNARLIRVPRNAFGIAENYQAKQQTKQYKQMIDSLLAKEKFGVPEYRMLVDDAVQQFKKNVIRNMINTGQQEEREALQSDQRILHAVLPDEVENPNLLRLENRLQEIAHVAQVPVSRVKRTFNIYENYKQMHKFLKQIEAQKRPMPKNQTELGLLLKSEQTSNYVDKQKYARDRSEAKKKMMEQQRKQFIENKQKEARLKRLPYKV